MAATTRLRFTVADQDGARQMVRASLPDVHGEALLLCGGERAQAYRLTEATFAWVSREVRRGRETVTIGRLQVVLRHHFLEELHPAGRRRRRARTAARALEATREVIARGPVDDLDTLLRELPQLARAVVVLRYVDRLLLPDVAAALRMPEGIVAEIDAVVRDALEPFGGVPALRAALSSGPPPVALAGRVLAPLIEAVNPNYIAAPLDARPLRVGDGGGDGLERETGSWRARPTSRPFGTERPSRRTSGLVVALAIIAALAGITAARQLLDNEPRPVPAPAETSVPAACPTVAASTPVLPTLPGVGAPLSPQPRGACPAP